MEDEINTREKSPAFKPVSVISISPGPRQIHKNSRDLAILFMRKLKERNDFDRVKFVILFGSQAEGRANKMSDYDFAVYFDGDENERYGFLKSSNFNEKYDVKVFQDLPLYVRKEVLKGKVVYAKDMRFVYDVAYETIKAFGDFKKYYYDYIRMEYIT